MEHGCCLGWVRARVNGVQERLNSSIMIMAADCRCLRDSSTCVLYREPTGKGSVVSLGRAVEAMPGVQTKVCMSGAMGSDMQTFVCTPGNSSALGLCAYWLVVVHDA